MDRFLATMLRYIIDALLRPSGRTRRRPFKCFILL
jgi:hypothetical protein